MPDVLDVTAAALADAGRPPSHRVARVSGRIAALLRSMLPAGARDERVAFLDAYGAPAQDTRGTSAVIRLANVFDLSATDLDLLVLAALPEEHEGFCHVLRSLHPRGEPRATVALAAQLLDDGPEHSARPTDRWPLIETLVNGRLTRSGCISLYGDAPFPERSLVAAEGLWMVARGLDVWPAGFETLQCPELADIDNAWTASPEALRARALLCDGAAATVLVTADDEDIALWWGMTLAGAAGVESVALDWSLDCAQRTPLLRVHAAARGIVPVLRVRVPDDAPAAAALRPPDVAGPSIVCIRSGAPPARGSRPVVELPAARLGPLARQRVWRGVLPELADHAPALASRFALDPAMAAEVASDVRAVPRGDVLSVHHVAQSVRVRAAVSAASGVTIVRPSATWDDLVLKPPRLEQLHDAVARLRHQATVLDEWAFLGHRRGSRGVRLLFVGPPGTGKTLSAEVLAGALGVDLIVADVSRLVSKWIGETPKNLARIFDMAERSTAVILFDEADALFGKRTEVTDAHDRYANLETAYLLSRLERFEGMAILTTNLRQNIDTAFLRRLEFIVEFDEPGAVEREALWRCHVPAGAPLAADVNLAELAAAYRMTGALIRNAAVAAAFLAAADNVPIGRRQLLRAVRREYEKAGKAFPGDLPGLGT
jgi:hypothetical protein